MNEPILLADHKFVGYHVPGANCEAVIGQDPLTSDYLYCEQPYAVHPHGWLGRAVEGGSNTPCSVVGCGDLRLAKVHAGQPVEHLPTPIVNEVAPQAPITDSPAIQAWDQFSRIVRAKIIEKNDGYGDAWESQGYMGNTARILSKASRLRNLVWREGSDAQGSTLAGDEPVVDTLLDLAALAAFAMSNIDDSNKWGHE